MRQAHQQHVRQSKQAARVLETKLDNRLTKDRGKSIQDNAQAHPRARLQCLGHPTPTSTSTRLKWSNAVLLASLSAGATTPPEWRKCWQYWSGQLDLHLRQVGGLTVLYKISNGPACVKCADLTTSPKPWKMRPQSKCKVQT